MPLYRYVCLECEAEQDVYHDINDKPCCSSCGSFDLKKVLKRSSEAKRFESSRQPGDVVDKFIKDARQDLKKMKEVHRGREHD